jgi:peptidoglycan/xylan/chitin deacetylase (PgdA/CDA1 family)
VAVLSYHNIVPQGESVVGDRSLHLPLRAFREHLDCLQAHFEIVPLDRLFRPERAGVPRVAITFDDAYAGAVVAGAEELARRNLPATVFVSSSLLGRHSFWWDTLADEHGLLTRERRNHALWSLAGANDDVARWMTSEGIPPADLPEHAKSATTDELKEAVRAEITIGAHGSRHLNLAALDPERLAKELREPAEVLARDWTSFRPWVAYPYGLFSEAVVAGARTNYDYGFRIAGGLARPGGVAAHPFEIARINVPAGLTARGLRLRVSGLVS